jgi:hypothetical protein
MPRHFPRADRLIHQAERAAAEQCSYVEMLTALIRAAIDDEADPYLLVGAMVEGIAMTLAERVPQQKRHEMAGQTARLIGDRLRAHGVLD